MVSQDIHINQLGYRCNDRKIVAINGKGNFFKVIDKNTGKALFEGRLTGFKSDKLSGDCLCYGDFSFVKKLGTYYIQVEGIGDSYSFEIGEKPYNKLKTGLLKAFYYQRCGMELEFPHAFEWRHQACHTRDARIYGKSGKKVDCTGGWHDAGDYGKYIVPGAKALADLMLSFEFFPKTFRDEFNIPESGNGLPDILNECKYELNWFFKMQDPNTGGVHHKVTVKKFTSLDEMPEDDISKQYLMPVSAAATGDFVAVMAMASRAFKEYDIKFSNKCLTAARFAWSWLLDNEDAKEFKNPDDVFTGEYGDDIIIDERYWAAAELYRTTGNEAYYNEAIKCIKQGGFSLTDLGWADVAGYGTISLLLSKYDLGKAVKDKLFKVFIDKAEDLIKISINDGYGISLKYDEYIWGSNMLVANNAMHLIIAHILSPKEEYIQVAETHLHYLLGRNALNQCYVTGYGSKSIKYPHHRPSIADGVDEPVPGFLSGGPNSSLQDLVVQEYLKGQPSARRFIDNKESYSTNEVAIYWNSPFVFVVGYFDK